MFGRWLRWLAMCAWAGLGVGLVELVLVVLRVEFFGDGLYRKNGQFAWMIPVASMGLFALGAFPLTVIAGIRWKHASSVASYLLITLALMTPWLAVPGLRAFACLALAAGLACWVAPALQRRGPVLVAFLRFSTPVLLGALVLLVAVSGLRPVARATRYGPVGRPTADAPSILMVVMDTVRADATSLHGSERDTTPFLRSLAREGVTFERAIAPSPWTLPSHASFFTGEWTWDLAVGMDRPLGAEPVTLAGYLGSRGYATAGLVANTSLCTVEYGLSRGFARYEDHVVTPLEIVRASALGWMLCRHAAPLLDRLMITLGHEARHPLEYDRYRKSATEITDGALRWVGKKPGEPFFLFLNYFDAHDPYLLPPGVSQRYGAGPDTLEERQALRGWDPGYVHSRTPGQIQRARDAYDECLAYLDAELGRLCEGLKRLGRLDDTIVVITSDHGEHFGEHQIRGVPVLGHRATLYQPEIHVPLVIRAPGRVPAGVTIPGAVGLRDLPATIVAIAGLGANSSFRGRSLLADRTPSPAASEFAPARDLPPALRSPEDGARAVRAVVTAEHSYLRYGDGREELYDLQSDPVESKNLAAEPEAQRVLDALRETLRSVPTM